MKKISLLCAVVLMGSSMVGCVQRITDFTIISSKNIDLSNGANFKRDDKRIEGIDCKPIILFPIGVPNAKEALDKAIQNVPGCIGLVDGVLEHEYFSFLFGYTEYRVKGTCLIDPNLLKK
jgi:hypothetical protein